MKLIIKPLRLTTPKIVAEIAALSEQLGYKSTTEEISQRLNKVITSENDCLFIAIINNEVVGWIHGFYTIRVESEAFVEIAGLVVDRKWYRRQIGKSLITAVCEWALAFGPVKIRVRCQITRVESHQFYQKIGFSLNKQQMVFELG
ncbi:MAG: GNAT family N-acetyltransferase [Bacteroidota bacterium]